MLQKDVAPPTIISLVISCYHVIVKESISTHLQFGINLKQKKMLLKYLFNSSIFL